MKIVLQLSVPIATGFLSQSREQGRKVGEENGNSLGSTLPWRVKWMHEWCCNAEVCRSATNTAGTCWASKPLKCKIICCKSTSALLEVQVRPSNNSTAQLKGDDTQIPREEREKNVFYETAASSRCYHGFF